MVIIKRLLFRTVFLLENSSYKTTFTIIVMLILAGVSLNAIVGDNGIISTAMDANVKSGMVALEEWLQEKYVEYYEDSEQFAKKPELLNDKIRNLLLKDGSRNFIMKDGKAYYLINKSSLPKEIREGLVGGNTTDYLKYIRLQDVYGVTDDLKVYYCNSDGDNIYGEMNVSDVDPNLPVGKINSDNGLKSLIIDELSKAGVAVDPELGVTIGNLESLKDSLEIDGSKYNITSLAGISELRNLRYLTLTNLGSEESSFNNLEGLESLTDLIYIYFKNCYINDYSNLETNWNLNFLYLYLPPTMSELKANEQLTNLGNGLNKANNIKKLENFGVGGITAWLEGTNTRNEMMEHESEESKSNLSDASGLARFHQDIKKSIKYLIFTNTSISSFSFLSDWSGLVKANLTVNDDVSSLANFRRT